MAQPNDASGFSLLEVVVALAMLAIVVTGMSGVYSTVTKASKSAQDSALVCDAARAKLSELEADVRETGALPASSGDFGDELKGWEWQATMEQVTSDNLAPLRHLEVSISVPGRGVSRSVAYAVYVLPGAAPASAPAAP